MVAYLIRRILIGMVTLVVITMLVYMLIRNMPGTPLTVDMAEANPEKQMSQQDFELAKKAYGLDKPIHIGYVYWLGNLARGDLGNSIRTRESVVSMIRERLGPTLLLSVSSLICTFLPAIPIGLFLSRFSGSKRERIVSVFFYGLYSLPVYVAGLWLLYVFYLKIANVIIQFPPILFSLKIMGKTFQLPPGMVSDHYHDLPLIGQVGDIAKHLILPLICYSYGSMAYDTRFIKSNMEEAMRQDYIRTARAKGVDDRTVISRHAFRNTLIPLVTLLGLSLPGLLSGAILIEQIFSWPGIGQMYYEAITFRDYNVIMGLTFMFAVATLAGQLFADILYAFVDPRVTHQ